MGLDSKISELTAGTPLDTDYTVYVDGVTGETKKSLKSELKGDTGETGATGADGTNGTDGADGTDGLTILNGTIDPTTEGVDGDFYINTTSNYIFGPKATTWGTGTSIVGPQGEQGIQGETGLTGDTGATGNGIDNIALISTVGLVKTYRITYTDATTFDYIVTDGTDGTGSGDMLKSENLSGLTNYTTARTNLGVDPAGTDNSTNVSLTGTPNYITIVGQVITRALINLTSHITGILPVANGGTGSTTKNFIDLTTAQTAEGLKTFSDGIVAKSNTNTQTGTTYTLVLTDQSKLIALNNASAITLTIPTNASVAFPIGTQIDLSQELAGAITVGGAGVTINSLDGNKTSNGQYVGLTLKKMATDEWNLYGNLTT